MSVDALTPAQAALLRKLPDLPSDGRIVKGASLQVVRRLGDRGFAVCTGYNAWTGRLYFARTKAGEAALHLPENTGK